MEGLQVIGAKFRSGPDVFPLSPFSNGSRGRNWGNLPQYGNPKRLQVGAQLCAVEGTMNMHRADAQRMPCEGNL